MTEPVLSILIPTLRRRKLKFQKLLAKLEHQVEKKQLGTQVEFVIAGDDGELTIGSKRNQLMNRARGHFIVFIDDDDDVHEDYVGLIVDALRSHPDIDCLGMRGEMIFDSGDVCPFVYSNRYRAYRTVDGVMQRPPHHLNPIKRSIALQFPYEDVRAHEDSDVALRMAGRNVLKKEAMIKPVLYRYYTRRSIRLHRLLERTEVWRHPLMLQRVYLVQLRRMLRNIALTLGLRRRRTS